MGVACGVIVGYLFIPPSLTTVKQLRARPKPHVERNIHDPPSERPGKSIKKDMSVQFREYIPKKIFLNIENTYSKSVDLFLDTYPHADDYVIYTFLLDNSYDAFYNVYRNHSLISPVLVNGSDQRNETKQFSFFDNSLNATISREIPSLDIASWIKTNTKQDDYVLMKVSSNDELAILEKLASSGAIEWVDKYYTTQWNDTVIQIYEDALASFSVKVYSWDAANGTYSDFDDVNPTHIPPVGAEIRSSCVDAEQPDKLAILFYADAISKELKRTLLILKNIVKERSTIGLFLPIDFLGEDLDLSSHLFTLFHGGIYITNDDFITSNNTDKEYFHIRNKIVKGSHIFQNFPTHPVLQYVMTHDVTNDGITDRLIRERHVTIYNTTSQASAKLPSHFNIAYMRSLNSSGFVSINLSEKLSDFAAFLILNHEQKHFIPITEC